MTRTALLAFAFLSACGPAEAVETPRCGYKVERVYPHDEHAFTQGLLYRNGFLFESTGLEGQSTIRMVRLANGQVVRSVAIPPTLFGEGLVDWKGELISVTWRSGIGFRWKIDSFERTGEFRYSGEGWGLTQDGNAIILSDGTSTLRFLDPLTMRERRSVTVTDNGQAVAQLNELEWVRGEILANVWRTNLIARIDPETGKVKAWIDLTGLNETASKSNPDHVLNGIAFDEIRNRLFVTGKNWPRVYQIRLVEPRLALSRRRTACTLLGMDRQREH